jgi:hypothetical protein
LSRLNFTEAFSRHKAKLVNPQWAVSAIADDGALVLSCWTHYFEKHGEVLRYRDSLSRWAGNELGNALARKHLQEAYSCAYPVRYVAARTDETQSVDSGKGASKLRKVFSVRADLVGQVVEFDGDSFVIDFRRA